MSVTLNSAEPSTPAFRWRRLGTIVAGLAAMVVILLLPPAWVPLGLLASLTGLVVVGRTAQRAGSAALVLAVLILAKQLYMPLSAWIAVGGLAVCAIVGFLPSRFKVAERWTTACLGLGWLSAAWMFFDYEFRSRRAVIDVDASGGRQSVVCIGDSLTAYGYPKVLSTMTDSPVFDLGEDGITTVHGVRKLNDVLAAQPRVVVIELGGHDYLKGYPREEIKGRLSHMIRDCQTRGAAVILFEIPCGLVTDPTRGVFREVAAEQGAKLIPDTAIRKLVFCSPGFPPCRWGWLPQLSDDGIHPNGRGNESLARAVSVAIEQLDRATAERARRQTTPSP
jgi:lysophospholipase L1-like esterase